MAPAKGYALAGMKFQKAEDAVTPGVRSTPGSVPGIEQNRYYGMAQVRKEILMLSLHLLRVSLVYVNTLMIQQVLAEPAWQGRLTAVDLRALSPLKWQHINPYGTFIWNMKERLPLEPMVLASSATGPKFRASLG